MERDEGEKRFYENIMKYFILHLRTTEWGKKKKHIVKKPITNKQHLKVKGTTHCTEMKSSKCTTNHRDSSKSRKGRKVSK